MMRKYEGGTSDPSVTHLAIMADLFGVSADYLLGRSDDPGGQYVPVINDLSGDERRLVARFREDGWYGVARLVVARLAGRSEE